MWGRHPIRMYIHDRQMAPNAVEAKIPASEQAFAIGVFAGKDSDMNV